MKPSEYIRKGWCQRLYAVDEYEAPCHPTSSLACAWCLEGAIQAAYPYEEGKRIGITKQLSMRVGPGIVLWNDDPSRKQQQVIELLESIGE